MPFEIRYVAREYQAQRYYDVRCDTCQAQLEPNCPVDPDGGWEWLSARDALKVRLISDYGAFFDSSTNTDPVALLRQACARRLVEALPGIDEVIRTCDAREQPLGGPFRIAVRDPAGTRVETDEGVPDQGGSEDG